MSIQHLLPSSDFECFWFTTQPGNFPIMKLDPLLLSWSTASHSPFELHLTTQQVNVHIKRHTPKCTHHPPPLPDQIHLHPHPSNEPRSLRIPRTASPSLPLVQPTHHCPLRALQPLESSRPLTPSEPINRDPTRDMQTHKPHRTQHWWESTLHSTLGDIAYAPDGTTEEI